MSNTFNPGDRVVYVGRHLPSRIGQHGTVMKSEYLIDPEMVVVKFDGGGRPSIVFLENVELLQSLTQAHLNAREEQISQLHQQLDNADVRINSLQSEIKTLKDRIQLVSRVSIKRYMLIGKLRADAAINEGYTETLAKRLVDARNHLERVRSAINTYEPFFIVTGAGGASGTAGEGGINTGCTDRRAGYRFGLQEGHVVMGPKNFASDTAADHGLTEEEAAAIRCDTPDCCGSTSDAKGDGT